MEIRIIILKLITAKNFKCLMVENLIRNILMEHKKQIKQIKVIKKNIFLQYSLNIKNTKINHKRSIQINTKINMSIRDQLMGIYINQLIIKTIFIFKEVIILKY